MGHEIITGNQPGAPDSKQRAALERLYAEAGLPSELAHDLDILWRQMLEVPQEDHHSHLTADEIAALEPVFAPLWRSRHGSIAWVELLNVQLTARPGPARTRRYPEMKRTNEKRRSLLRRLATTDFWELAATRIEALKTLDPERKDRLLVICRTQAMRKRSMAARKVLS